MVLNDKCALSNRLFFNKFIQNLMRWESIFTVSGQHYQIVKFISKIKTFYKKKKNILVNKMLILTSEIVLCK
jgi:hypothetical protein